MLAAVCLLASSCNNAPSSPSNQDTAKAAGADKMGASNMLEKNKATAMASIQAFNNHDASAVLKDIAPDFVDYGDGSMPPIKGMDSCKAMIQSYLTAFPDVKGDNLSAIAEGDQVAVFGDWSGTFKAKLMNMEPTGKSFKMKDVDLFTFNSNGQITSHRSIQSNASMMMQVAPDKKK
jgi:predicted ester cyclase